MVLAASAAMLLSGCADLQVEKLAPDDMSARTGDMIYALPRTAINVTVTVTVSQCGSLSSDGPPDVPAAQLIKENSTDLSGPEAAVATKGLIFKATAVPTPGIEADPNFRYVIRYAKAENWTKEINFTVNTTPTKVFQSFNGQINDQVGPIAVATLTAAVQIAGAAFVPGAGVVHDLAPVSEAAKQTKDAKALCSDDVVKALTKVSADQVLIKRLNARIAAYRGDIAGTVTPGRADPTTAWAQAVAALQSDISTTTTKSLSRSMIVKWVPDPKDMALPASPAGRPQRSDVYVGYIQLPISPLVMPLLSPTGLNWYSTPQLNPQYKLNVWYPAHAPLMLVIAVDAQTYFDQSKPAGSDAPPDPLGTDPGGLVIRDPAIGIVQKCSLPKDQRPDVNPDASGVWRFNLPPNATSFVGYCSVPTFTTADLSPMSDDSSRIPVSIPQFGRPLVLTAHSALFENASLAVTLNADGSIQSIGTHDLSTAATGLTGLAAAAADASQAQAAHNTAVAAVNTATLSQIQLPDNRNKALSDCITQAQAIVKGSSLTPWPCQ
jgi:hypothetical protein